MRKSGFCSFSDYRERETASGGHV